MANKRSRVDICSPVFEVPEIPRVSPLTSKKRKMRSSSSAASPSNYAEEEYEPSIMPVSCLIPTFDSQTTSRIKPLKPRGRQNAVDLLISPVSRIATVFPVDETDRNKVFLSSLFLDWTGPHLHLSLRATSRTWYASYESIRLILCCDAAFKETILARASEQKW